MRQVDSNGTYTADPEGRMRSGNTGIKVATSKPPAKPSLPPPTLQHVTPADGALVASAQVIDPNGDKPKSYAPSMQPWQHDALEAPQVNETAAFAASTVETMGRHVRFNIEKINESGVWEEHTKNYQEVLTVIRDDSLSQEGLAGSAVRLLFLAGEVYFSVYSGELPHLVALSPAEVNMNSVRRGSIMGKSYDANTYSSQTIGNIQSTDAPDYLIRAWQPDDLDGKRAFSNMRSAASAIRELQLIDDLSAALLVSRISGAGILLVPDETAFEDDTDDTASYISKALTDVASIAIAEPSLPEAHVPIVITAPADLIKEWRLLEMNTATEEKLLQLRESANKRVERAVDLPELILDPASTNHWAMATTIEMASNYFVARAAQRVATALTVGLLMQALDTEDIGKYRIGIVLTGLVSRARAMADAIELYDRNLISDKALREIAGYDNSDAASTAEAALRTLTKLALAQPGTFGLALLQKLGIDIEIPVDAPAPDAGGQAIVPVGQNPNSGNKPVTGEGPGQQTIDAQNAA